ETGLAGADRAAVGARSRRYGDHSGDWQDQANRLSWRDRYLTRGVAGLERDATRPGRKPPLDATAIERVVNMTLNEKPPGGHALVAAQDGQGDRSQPFERAAHLGGA